MAVLTSNTTSDFYALRLGRRTVRKAYGFPSGEIFPEAEPQKGNRNQLATVRQSLTSLCGGEAAKVGAFC
jgi:hypothetical protein